MKYVVIGFVLLALAGLLERWGNDTSSGADRLPANVIALVLLLGAGLLFVRAILTRRRR